MKSPKINVEESIIEWIISKNNIPSDIIELFEEIKNNNFKVPFTEIEKISNKTNIPLGYFFLKQPPKETLSVIEYRTIDSLELENPSRNLIDTIYHMQNVQDWMKDYLTRENFEKLDFIGSQKNQNDHIKITNAIRKNLNIKENWLINCKNTSEAFKKIRRLLNELGILVMANGIVGANTKRVLDLNEFRAFTLIDDFAPLIFINNNDSESAKVFSLLHEAVHIWLGIDSFYNMNNIDDSINSNNNNIEKICNKVAAELIAPKELFIEFWNKSKSIDLIDICSEVSKKFKCSKIVIARRALDNKLISKLDYDEIVQKNIEEYSLISNKKKKSGGDYYKVMLTRLDNNFIKALYSSVKEGKTQFTEAYRLTNTNRHTFEKIVEKVGVIKY